MQPQSNSDHLAGIGYTVKTLMAWLLYTIGSVTAEDVAKYLAITYTALAIVALIRREFFPKKTLSAVPLPSHMPPEK